MKLWRDSGERGGNTFLQTSVTTYKTTRRYNPGNYYLQYDTFKTWSLYLNKQFWK
jgi:hypothetical protein